MNRVAGSMEWQGRQDGEQTRYARQNLRVLAGILAVFMLGTGALYLRSGADAATGPARPMPVATSSVSFENAYSVEQRFAGRIESARQVPVAFERPGLITEIHVEEGQRVLEGQKIATMDTDVLNARRDQLVADRERTLAELELAQLTTERQQALSKAGYASVQRFDDARLSATALEASVAAIDSSIHQVDIDIRKSNLKAPFDGLVGQQIIDAGTVVNAGMGVVDLYETTRVQARIGLPPDVAASLVAGTMYPMIYGDRTLDAQLISVRSDLDQVTQTVAALFQFTEEAQIPFGAVVHYAHKQEVRAEGVWLPLSALIEGEKGLWSVYVVAQDGEDARVKRESVEVIHVEGNKAYVRGTLRQGVEVLTGGTNRVAPGQRVAVAG